MKRVHLDPVRGYRDRCVPREGECRFRIVVGETDLQVTAAAPLSSAFIDAMTEEVRRLRGRLEAWIVLHPEFRDSLVPVPLREPAGLVPEIVRRMSAAALAAGVGPFAAVAGAIAQLLVERFAPQSPDLIVENGGDIYMASRRDRVVGLLPDPEAGVTLGLKIAASGCPTALCSSSATIGHSLSFGRGELALVRSPDGAFADALATALGNRLHGPDDVEKVIDLARGFASSGLVGVYVQCGSAVGIWGDMELTVVENVEESSSGGVPEGKIRI